MRIYILIFLLFFTQTLFSETVQIDNYDLQAYRGKTGRWIFVQSYNSLKYLSKQYLVSIEAIREANGGSLQYNRYLFVPFSDEMIAELNKAEKPRTIVQSSNDEFIWPVENVYRITSAFGMRNGELHVGVDLPAVKGHPVVAARDGRVVLAKYIEGYGKLICIEHRNHFYTRYSHNSEIFIQYGDYVRKGQVIGLVGSTGHSTGNHLHFEIRYNDIPLNPLDFLPENNEVVIPHHFLRRNWK